MSGSHAIAVLLLGALVPVLSSAAHAAEDDARLWGTAVVAMELRPGLEAALSVQARTRDGVSEIERLLIGPSLTWSLPGGTTAGLGYDAHLIEVPRDTVEHRAWQQVGLRRSLGATDAHGRLRLEERFLEGLGGASLRARFRVGLDVPLAGSGWSFQANDELFWHLTSHHDGPDQGFDQNRLFLGVGLPAGRSTRWSVGYLLQYVHRRTGPDAANHILAVTLRFAP